MDTAPTYSPPLSVIGTLAWRELVRFFRQRNRVIGGLVQPLLFWLMLSEGLRENALGYQHFFPGTLVMILLFTAIFATISVIEDRNEGFLQGVLVAPTQRMAIALGKIVGGAAIAMLQGTLFLCLGLATGSAALGGPVEAIGLFAAMTLIAVALTALGFAIAWKMDSAQGFHAIMSVFLLPMWLLSGSFFRVGAAGVLDYVVAINPLTYGVALVRRLITPEDVTGLPSEPVCWGVTIAFAVAMVVASWRVALRR